MFILKGAIVVSLLLFFFGLGLIIYPLYLINSDKMRPFLSSLTQLVSVLILKTLNVKVTSDFELNQFKGKTIICNHLSYLDMLIILSKVKTSFLTSIEIKETPFLGQVCQLAGCFFTERRNKKNLSKEVQSVKKYLSTNQNMAFFPEGTSTDASEVLRFKKPFFYPAHELNEDIIAIALNYNHINKKPFSLNNRDLICWYGNKTFFRHFIKLLKIKSILASMTHEVIRSENDIDSTITKCRNFVVSNFHSLG